MPDQIDEMRWSPSAGGPFLDKPGSYRLVARAGTNTICPGDEFTVEMFVTGYGYIAPAPKLYFLPPAKLVDHLTVSSGYVQIAGAELGWGAPEEVFDNHGFTICLLSSVVDGQLTRKGFVPISDRTTMFSHAPDWDPENKPAQRIAVPVIALENWLPDQQGRPRAPIEITIKTKKCRYGNYALQFCLTYFDGERWNVASSNAQIRVLSRAERNAWPLAVIGALTAIIGVGAALVSLFSN